MLYLVQHAAAVPKKEDPERPLSNQGRTDLRAMAAMLVAAGVRVGRVIHSGKTRARQTAQLLAMAVAPDCTPAAQQGLNPKDDPAALAAVVESWSGDCMVVGHQPFMGGLVAHLIAAPDGGEVVAFRPGSVVALEQDQAAGWRIAWMIRPDLFPKA